MESGRRNRNRGYQQLRVWCDAIELYRLTCSSMADWPHPLKRVAAQQIAAVDSVHRNIAEGYGRRSINEYLQHLYIALASLGESVSGLVAMRTAAQLGEVACENLDALSYRIENGLIRLIERIELKREAKDWIDHMVVRESNEAYVTDQEASTPSLHHSTHSGLLP